MADENAPDAAADETPAPQPSPLPPPSDVTIPKEEQYYTPIFIITATFGALFIILPLIVRKGPYKGLLRCCIMLSLFCMWIFWVTIYISQMNPLLGPRMRNTTVAWLAHKIVRKLHIIYLLFSSEKTRKY
ncbi:unnamed protein product [Parnassius mnemosyne]|uniref:Uncharacterized protein n=1 Tax=Parnassius mnemosyne TaxID=213953 RepID=A0AAV1LL74_9NEOP